MTSRGYARAGDKYHAYLGAIIIALFFIGVGFYVAVLYAIYKLDGRLRRASQDKKSAWTRQWKSENQNFKPQQPMPSKRPLFVGFFHPFA